MKSKNSEILMQIQIFEDINKPHKILIYDGKRYISHYTIINSEIFDVINQVLKIRAEMQQDKLLLDLQNKSKLN